MIVRSWRARATPENAPRYREHLETHVFPVLTAIDGFIDAALLERATGDDVELLVQSRWVSVEAIRAFAGDTYERAVVAPGARAVLLSFDEDVSHHQVSAVCSP